MIHFCVFSFNRGRFLRHCVETIESCAPQCTVSIYDDGSDDADTTLVLGELSSRHRVVECVGELAGSKHGGLYQNMQRALDDLAPGTIACFIQDDMQLVRSLDDDEVGKICARFNASMTQFVQPAFLKGCNREADRGDLHYDPEASGYRCDRFDRSAGAFYSDVFIAAVDQLRRVDWQFGTRESSNERQARDKMQQMLILRDPFVAWLPSVPAWRGRMRTLALRYAEKTRRCDFHPIEIMSEAEIEQLLARDPATLPVAEDSLKVRGGGVSSPWLYHPLQGSRMLKLLDSVERKLR